MATALLAFGLRLYSFRSNNTTRAHQKALLTKKHDKDEELSHSRGPANATSHDGEFSQNVLSNTTCSMRGLNLAESSATPLQDVTNTDPETVACDSKHKDDYQAFPALQEMTASFIDDGYDTRTPVVFGPNGSGYKGKDKSLKEYTTTSEVYDYQGSYAQPSRNKRHRPSEEDSDSDEASRSPGKGSGPPDRRGGPPDGDETNINSKRKKKQKEMRDPLFAHRETCNGCGVTFSMVGEFGGGSARPLNYHPRCTDCLKRKASQFRVLLGIPKPQDLTTDLEDEPKKKLDPNDDSDYDDNIDGDGDMRDENM